MNTFTSVRSVGLTTTYYVGRAEAYFDAARECLTARAGEGGEDG